jgi:DUF438 domain-containing protein
MNLENFIPLTQLCTHFEVEMSFFTNLKEVGLIEITTIEQSLYVPEEKVSDIEKIIRMHHELEINLEGIETILHLIEKIEALQSELTATKNRLRLYEE